MRTVMARAISGALKFCVRHARIVLSSGPTGRRKSPTEPTPGSDNAKGTARPEASGRHDFGRDHGNWRNRREAEGAFGQGSIWEGRGEGACREDVGGGALGSGEESGRCEVEMNVPFARPRWDLAREKARALTKNYKSPPIPVVEIAEQQGARVVFADFGINRDLYQSLKALPMGPLPRSD
jgi:hypothetical protein